ncbi:3-deoxy-D-manno-octulosonate 8-phosphate phosphatase, partial [Campylobacter upsaliensis]|nr:3-deoxy-D-manno-octulosonate 8-phosphate phosphatase [Campylobacter upsaliensis]
MIELIFLDIDGCLTDGKIIYTQNGGEIKEFDV